MADVHLPISFGDSFIDTDLIRGEVVAFIMANRAAVNELHRQITIGNSLLDAFDSAGDDVAELIEIHGRLRQAQAASTLPAVRRRPSKWAGPPCRVALQGEGRPALIDGRTARLPRSSDYYKVVEALVDAWNEGQTQGLTLDDLHRRSGVDNAEQRLRDLCRKGKACQDWKVWDEAIQRPGQGQRNGLYGLKPGESRPDAAERPHNPHSR